MDGRKNNKGTKGNKGGRTPKAQELKLAEKMRNILGDEELLKSIAEIIRDNNHKDRFKAMELWSGYLYGKPTQRVETKEIEEIPQTVFVDATSRS